MPQDTASISIPCRLATGIVGEVGLEDIRGNDLRTASELACSRPYWGGDELGTKGVLQWHSCLPQIGVISSVIPRKEVPEMGVRVSAVLLVRN